MSSSSSRRSSLVAQWDFSAVKGDQLSFKKGESLDLIEKNESGWWVGVNGDGVRVTQTLVLYPRLHLISQSLKPRWSWVDIWSPSYQCRALLQRSQTLEDEPGRWASCGPSAVRSQYRCSGRTRQTSFARKYSWTLCHTNHILDVTYRPRASKR